VAFEPFRRGALVDLHAVLDEQALETLHAQQRIDAVGARVTKPPLEFSAPMTPCLEHPEV
jgi:hypothetical protein